LRDLSTPAKGAPKEFSLHGETFAMRRRSLRVALGLVFVTATSLPTRADSPHPILVRPGMLAAQIGELAGQTVRVPYSRVVGVFNPRAFLIDTSTRLPPIRGHRARVLVLVERGELSVPASSLVASTVTIAGVARTLLGMQVSREVPWPKELNPGAIERLEVRAAVLATSVQTAEGIELTAR
jgi:hypothetical protein